ncbi:MAG: heme o synthase [Planctomycetaceae bacterium]|nr:heme o synthase [Planctomycetaceae bacterium]
MLVRHYAQLGKAPITAMVLLTTGVGYLLAPVGSDGRVTHSVTRLVVTLLGTGLTALGAAAFNELLEIRRDAKMRRTCRRPLPTGAISPTRALLFAVVTTLAGLAILAASINCLTAALASLNVAIYTLVYTSLKPRTSLSTLVGSICGALPPVMGSTAASGRLSPEAALLAGILLLWQIPHALSLVWLHRDDYARAGFRLLPVVDRDGRLTCLTILYYWLALTSLGLLASLSGLAGQLFAAASFVLGAAISLLALQFCMARSERNARRMFWASILYLPLLLALLVADCPAKRSPDDPQYAPNHTAKAPVDT